MNPKIPIKSWAVAPFSKVMLKGEILGSSPSPSRVSSIISLRIFLGHFFTFKQILMRKRALTDCQANRELQRSRWDKFKLTCISVQAKRVKWNSNSSDAINRPSFKSRANALNISTHTGRENLEHEWNNKLLGEEKIKDPRFASLRRTFMAIIKHKLNTALHKWGFLIRPRLCTFKSVLAWEHWDLRMLQFLWVPYAILKRTHHT